MPAGRPTDYTIDLADEFSRRVATGRSVLAVCGDLDMPSDTTVYRWRQEKPEFRDKLACAREDRLEAYSDRIMALGARVVEEDEFDPMRCNAAVNAIDKAARLQAPKKVELTGAGGIPLIPEDVGNRDLAKAVIALLGKAVASDS